MGMNSAMPAPLAQINITQSHKGVKKRGNQTEFIGDLRRFEVQVQLLNMIIIEQKEKTT